MTPGQMAEQLATHTEQIKELMQGVSNFRTAQ
jgi:hypothetical protein